MNSNLIFNYLCKNFINSIHSIYYLKLLTMKKLMFLALLLISSVGFVKAQDDATIEETIDWMKGKLEGFSYSRYYDYGILPKDKGTRRYKYKVINSGNCSMTIEEVYNNVTNANHTRNDYSTTTHYKVNFSEIKSIEYNDNNNRFLIKTYNDEPLIVVTNASGGNYRKTKELSIYAQNLGDLVTRFPKAFRHAMELCGAKEEKF